MNSFPMRSQESVTQSLFELAETLGAPVPETDMEIRGIAPIADAGPDQIGFVAQKRYVAEVAGSRAGALLVSEDLVGSLPEDPRPRLVVQDAHVALLDLLESFFPRLERAPEIHSTAVLGRGVRLGRGVTVAPYAVIEAEAEIGDGCSIGSHCVIGSQARIGRDCVLHPQVVVYPRTVIGERVVLHAGSRIGVDGFGYVFRDGRHQKVPQVGACVVEDDVEIGANTTIDRGSIGETRVQGGAKLDNLVQLGHNVRIGPHAILAGQVGVAGSTRVGAGVMAGGQVGIAGHLRVGDGAKLAAKAGVVGDVEPGASMLGYPARPRIEFLRGIAGQAKVHELLGRVKQLERAMASGHREAD